MYSTYSLNMRHVSDSQHLGEFRLINSTYQLMKDILLLPKGILQIYLDLSVSVKRVL